MWANLGDFLKHLPINREEGAPAVPPLDLTGQHIIFPPTKTHSSWSPSYIWQATSTVLLLIMLWNVISICEKEKKTL